MLERERCGEIHVGEMFELSFGKHDILHSYIRQNVDSYIKCRIETTKYCNLNKVDSEKCRSSLSLDLVGVV